MVELEVNAICEHLKWNRRKATFLVGGLIFLAGIPLALNEKAFDFVVNFSTVYMVLIGALLASLALCWFFGVRKAKVELNRGAIIRFGGWWKPLAKWVYPLIIGIILVGSVLGIGG
jgi:NSS family neurotransmitter:Na+ symporter